MNTSRPRCTRVLTGSIAALAATLLATPVASAQLQWDPGLTPGTPSGGLGVWDTTSPFWSDGFVDTTWNSLIANFGGVAGVVTIGNAGVGVSATGLIFDTTGYTIAAQTPGDVLTLTGAPEITVNGLTSDTATISAIVAGNAGLSKWGIGTLILSGVNTFTGGLTINSGTVSVAADANLGAAGGLVTLDGGTLSASAAITSSRQLSLGANFGNTVTTTAGASVWTGQITGQGGFIKNGAGSLELGGATANTYEGLAEVNQGTLLLNKSSGNAIGAGGITVTSNSTAGFGAANISLSASEQIDNTAPISLFANGSLRAGFDLNNFTETVGAVTLNSTTIGSATIALGATGKLILTQDLIFNNNRNAGGNTGREVLITGTGTYATAGVGGTLDLGGGPRTITVNTNNVQANTDATIEAVIENGSLIKSGARVLRLGAVNSYSALTVNEGTVRALVNGAIPAGIPLTVSGTNFGQTATLDFGGFNYTLTPANALIFGGGSGGATIATGGGTLTLATPLVVDLTNDPQTLTVSGNLNLNGIQDTFDIGDSANTATELVISAIISGSTTGLTKNGAGTLALAGANNSFTGPVTVNSGALALRAANTISVAPQINAGGALLFDTALADIATFNSVLGAATGISVNGGTIRGSYNTDRTLTNRPVTVGAAGATFDIVGNYTDFVEAGVTQLRFAGGTHNLIGSGTVTKDGGGRLQFQVASANFSGPVIVNNGTLETSGVALGNASATNTVTVNGGNLSLTGDSSQPLITLNGGALSVTGASRVVNGQINVTAGSYAFLNDFWRDFDSATPTNNIGRTITHNGLLTGSSEFGIAVNRAGYQWNNGTFVLRNAANSYSGIITVGKNLNLENNSSTGSGKTIGTAAIVLAGGHLRLRDNGAGSNGTLAYGNDVTVTTPVPGSIFERGTLAGTAAFDLDRSSGANTGNTIQFDTLLVEAPQLDVAAANNYRLQFTGLTTFTTSPIINVTTGTLTLGGGLTATGQTLTKNGAGTLRIVGAVDLASYTLNGGTLEIPIEPPGVGRNLTLPFGVGYSAGYVATQANLIDRITFDSAGVVALGVDSTFNPDFTGFIGGLRLGGTGNAILTGAVTPATGTVLLGGGGGTLTLASTNAVTGPVNLDVNTNGTATGTVVLAAANNFSGTLTVGGGMTLRAGLDTSLGIGVAPIGLDNATLQTGFNGTLTRAISVGAGGATLDTDGNSVTMATAIAGTGIFNKTGSGTLTLTNTAGTFAGKTVVRAGTLSVSADTNLGAVPGAVTADQVQLAGGTLQATGTFTIPVNRGVNLGAGGGTFDVTGANTLTLASIMTGANPFTKIGTGTLLITADPNNSGLYTINEGVLALQHAGSTDASMVINNGGTLRIQTANDLGDATTVTVNTGGTFDLRAGDTIAQLLGSGTVTNTGTAANTLTVNSATNPATPFSGVIQNGAFPVNFSKGGANTVTLTGTNTSTGTTVVSNGRLVIEGAAGALGNTAITVGDNNGGDESMIFGNVADVTAGTLNRIGDTGTLTFSGRTQVIYNGPAAGSGGFNETLGAITTQNGANVLTLNPASGADVQLSPASLGRALNGTLLVRGANLGGTGAGTTRVVVTAAPALVGGGGAAGSTNISVVPFVVGDTSATGAGSSFVTHDVNGLRLLTNAEYAATISGTAGRNVSVAGGETVSSNAAINALRVTGGTTSVASNTTVSLASGAVLFTGAGAVNGPGTIDFGAAEGIVHVAQNTTAITGTINASIAGGSGLTVGSLGFDGAGAFLANTIVLGGNNTFAGNLTINTGILRFGSSNVINPLNPVGVVFRPGASLQIGGNTVMVRDIGANNSGGTFSLSNTSASSGTLIDLAVAGSTWASAITDGTGGGSLSLSKRGTGTLTLTAANTFSGSTTLDRGAIVINGGGRLTSTGADGSTAINIAGASIFRLTNTSGTGTSTDRLRNNAPITVRGTTFDFDNTAVSGTNYSETAGDLILAGGFNTVTADQAASANTTTLTFASLTRNAGSQAQINFNSQVNGTTTVGLIGANTRDRVVFTTPPTLNDGMVGGWAFVDGVDFATYNGLPSVGILAATTDAETAWDTTKNVKPTASVALTGARTVNSLNFASGQNLNLGGFTLNVDSGGVIHQTTVTTDTISNGTITAGNTAGADLVIRVTAAAGILTESANAIIADNGAGAVGLVKTGGGKLVLAGANTYSGPTFIGGALSIAADNALGTAPASPAPGHLKIYDGGTLEVTSGMTLNANRGIELGGAGATINVTTGTLTYDGVIASPGHTDLTVVGNANFGGNNTIGGSTNFNSAQTVNLSGATTSIGSGLNVGFQSTATAVFTSNVNFTGIGGTLTLGMNTPGASDLSVGYRTATPSPDTGGTSTIGRLDLTALSNFTASVANIRVGMSTSGANATVRGDLLLPPTSTITASGTVFISDSTANGNATVQSSIVFGNGINTLTAPTVIAGGKKGNGLLRVATGGTLNLRGFGANTTDLLVAFNNQDATGVTSIGTADFSTGTLIASLDELVVGFKNGAGGSTGGATGTMTLGPSAHTIVATQLRLGDSQGGSSGTTSGTLNVGGGSLTVNTNVSIGLRTGTAGIGTGLLNITGGTVTVGGNITTTNSANANSTLTLNGGTLDMTGGTINVDTFNAQAGTLDDVAGLFAGDGTTPAALTKTTAGTLILTGQQNYGTLNTNAGITELDAALGTGASTINANATINISVSQTLAALNIGAGAVVTLEADPGPAPAGAESGVASYGSDQTLTPLDIGDGNTVTLGTDPEAAAAIAAVPEPGAFGLLALGALGILGRRRREQGAVARD